MWSVLKFGSLWICSASAISIARGGQSVWNIKNFNSLLTFGDSYTDENRLNYFGSHNGEAPPAGTILPESNSTAGGGRTWPRYVVQYTGNTVNDVWNPQLMLYNYAVSGAVCSNLITPRFVSIPPGSNLLE